MTYYGYKIDEKTNCIILHKGKSFEFLRERGYETGNDSFFSQNEAYAHAKNVIDKKKNPAE